MVVFVVFVVPPSPKVQERFVIVPVELSVNVTVRGMLPVVGTPVKFADGGCGVMMVKLALAAALIAPPRNARAVTVADIVWENGPA